MKFIYILAVVSQGLDGPRAISFNHAPVEAESEEVAYDIGSKLAIEMGWLPVKDAFANDYVISTETHRGK